MTDKMADEVQTTLRDRQRAGVRDDILAAVGASLADGGVDELSFARVAERAGVSERTVYRYFPSRHELLTALSAWVRDRIGEAEPPARADELPASTRRAFAHFEEHADLVRVLLRDGVGDEVRRPSRARRLRQLDETLGDALADVDPLAARNARAVIGLLYSAATWRALRDEAGLDGEAAADAAAWAVEALLAAAAGTTPITTDHGGRRP
jgi:AcrR family transcriptional regulator